MKILECWSIENWPILNGNKSALKNGVPVKALFIKILTFSSSETYF